MLLEISDARLTGLTASSCNNDHGISPIVWLAKLIKPLACIAHKSLGFVTDAGQAFLFGKIVILTLTWITNATARMIIDSKQDLPMKSVKKSTLFHLIIELTIYAVFVSVYLILVLHFLLDWLKELFTKQREVYAYVAILLMIGQAVGLERVTSSLVHLTRRRTE